MATTPQERQVTSTTPPQAGVLYTAAQATELALQPLASPQPYTRPRAPVRFKEQKALLAVRVKDADRFFFQQFLLTHYTHTDQERFQFMEHTEGWTAFFYGRQPLVWAFQGLVFDGYAPYDWRNGLMDFYRTYLRGSQIASRDYPAYVQFSGRGVHGYALSLGLEAGQPNDAVCAFKLRLLATHDEPLVVQDALHPPLTEAEAAVALTPDATLT